MRLLAALLFATSLSAQTTAELTEVLQPLLKRHAIPGLAAAVVRMDGPIVVSATGVNVQGKTAPLRAESRFHIGSITKPITATMIATLVDEGFLSWDLTVRNAFPQWRSSIRPEYLDVTLAQLLAHEGRIQPFTDDSEIARLPKMEGTPVELRRALAKHVLSMEPVSTEKKHYQYSNAGFTVATVMAEQVTGQPWETLVRERIFDVFGMKNAGFGWPAATFANEPWGHWDEKGKLVPHDPKGTYQLQAFIAPAGDVHLTLEELARFARAHMVALNGQKTIVKPETATAMHTRRLRSGLGWGVQELEGHSPVSVYSGSAGTFTTMIAVGPKQDVAVVVAANAGTEAANAAVRTALRELFKKYAPPIVVKERRPNVPLRRGPRVP